MRQVAATSTIHQDRLGGCRPIHGAGSDENRSTSPFVCGRRGRVCFTVVPAAVHAWSQSIVVAEAVVGDHSSHLIPCVANHASAQAQNSLAVTARSSLTISLYARRVRSSIAVWMNRWPTPVLSFTPPRGPASRHQAGSRRGCYQATVVKWRTGFIERELDCLPDDPRPATPRSITDDDVEAVIVRTLDDKPIGATLWSTRDLASRAGTSPSSVGRIWRAYGLKTHSQLN